MTDGGAGPPSTDVFTPAERSAVMRRVRGRDTGPERAVRRLLTGLGLRYRLQRRDLPGSPDIAMAGRRTAVFVHGCFWHGHDCRRGARTPKQNADYWRAKIARNVARDVEAAERLRGLGWRPLVVWECELRDEVALVARLAAELARDQGARVRAASTASPESGVSSDAAPALTR